MDRPRLNFTNIDDREIQRMLEKDLDVEMYDLCDDDDIDEIIGRTSRTNTARLSEIHGKIYLHLVSKNMFLYGTEQRIYSYDMINKKVCKVSQIKKEISDETYQTIVDKYHIKLKH